jgi:RNA polymerase sigma factor (sigma-70 family)
MTLPPSKIDHEAEAAALACIRRDQLAEALKILMKAYGRPLTSFILRNVRYGAAVEDVRQQVFLEAFVGMKNFEGRSSLWTWLCGIAYHRCVDETKRQQKSTPDPTIDVLKELRWQPDPTMDPKAETERHNALEHCLGKIPQPWRTVLLMRFHLGLSYVEIERLIGVAAGTIQVRLARIMPKLRLCLKKKGVVR